ncbi:MAG: DNA primase catalytic subunit PriS [Methanomicrobiales archaeon]
MNEPATLEERRKYYREEWNVKEIPDFIKNRMEQREFGFDHLGKGPNDRYKIFRSLEYLKRFIRYKSPFAAYCSVAFYDKPFKRADWIKSELVFDVDAKDIPIRTCNCDNVCEICLNQAKDIVSNLMDTLTGDLGLKNIHVVYSGRGYHLRVLDEEVMGMDSEIRAQILKYIVGSEVPKSEYGTEGEKYKLEHFSIPFGYPKVFTKRVKYDILHLNQDTKLENLSKPLIKKVLNNRKYLNNDQWGLFRKNVGPVNYKKLIKELSDLNMSLVDAKVSIDLKRILRLPTSLHSKVSMKCMEVKNIENFDPFKHAVPNFVYERDD